MALADALHSLLRLPGATYSCVVERDSGRVLAEVGQGESASGDSEGVVPYSVPRWGTAVAAMFDSTSGDELDDVMITGRRSYHLVRPIGPGASVLVYLRLDRSRSNLAAARRELATVRLAGGAVPATTPAAPAVPAARSRSEATAPGARSEAAARSRSVAATPPAPPSRVPAALAPPSTPARGVRRTAASAPSGATGAGSSRSSTDTDASRAAATPTARSTGLRSSGSRSSGPPSSGPPSSGSPSSGDTLAGRARPGTTRQIPLPRRASTRSASDAGPVRQRSEAGPVGAVDAPGEPAPEGFAMPAVLGQSWARDPGTLRRLIAGLRRMT